MQTRPNLRPGTTLLWCTIVVMQTSAARANPLPEIDEAAAAERLAAAVRFKTLSKQDAPEPDHEAFMGLHQHLRDSFPLAHEKLELTPINTYSLLFKWTGTNPALKPAIFMAHQDVVPVAPDTLDQWVHPPYAGKIADGFIWGRGSMDFKNGVVGLLDAVEHLLRTGHTPERTIYLAFGHDEETLGMKGAPAIVKHLLERGVQAEFVLDEGLVITQGMMPGVEKPVAMVGVAEKGFVSVELIVDTEGGHSSMPPPHTAVGIMSRAIVELEDNPMPSRISLPVQYLFEAVGPHLPWLEKTLFGNLGIFGALIRKKLAGAPPSNALIRTTTAATVIEGSIKDNVLPTRSRAIINFRILPGDTIENVLAHIHDTVDDARIQVKPILGGSSNPSPVSCVTCPQYERIAKTIGEVYPDVVVAPSLVVGATDSRHFGALTNAVYRFNPMRMRPEDTARVHGLNERISTRIYADSIRFFMQMLKNSN